MITILTGVKWHFTVVLIFIFLMINDVEYLFMCLMTMSSLEKCLFRSYTHLKILFISYWRIIALQNFVVFCQTSTHVCLLMMSCMSSLPIGDINPLSDILFANIFCFVGNPPLFVHHIIYYIISYYDMVIHYIPSVHCFYCHLVGHLTTGCNSTIHILMPGFPSFIRLRIT